MENLESIHINFNQGQLWLLNICLGFLMFGVALEMKWGQFKEIIKYPRSYAIGLVSQLLLLPILTLLLIFIIKPHPFIALGMLLVAACPGGNVSNYAVHLAKGNIGLSVILTATSTLLCSFTTPILFKIGTYFLAKENNEHFQIDPWSMILSIVTLLLIPSLLGMSINNFFPKFTEKILKPVKILSFVIFISFIVFAVMGNLENIKQYIHIVFFIVIIHNSLGLCIGYFFPRFLKCNKEDSRCISIETGIQNSGLALVLIFNFFDGNGGMALIAAWWSIWHLLSAFGLAMVWRRN